MARSEVGYVLGKVHHIDLNLTQYPEKIDSRVEADAGYNVNMRGFENIKDYNMAEHINAVSDSVMSIQRSLGILPFIDKDGVDRTTVSTRITILENKDYDPRYGGIGWITSQTLVGHTHTGELGHPSQINLASETQGKLAKGNLNLTFGDTDAVTGAEVPVSNTDSRKIADAINDKLSVTQGGTIQKNLEVKGNFMSRIFREWDADDITGGSLITDYSTVTNKVRRTSGTAETWFMNSNISNLLYGKYVIAYRLRTSSLTSQEVFRTGWYSYMTSGWVYRNGISVKGSDFTAAEKWQMFYQTVDHDGEHIDSTAALHVVRSATSISANIDLDSIIIMPTHPAIYDK